MAVTRPRWPRPRSVITCLASAPLLDRGGRGLHTSPTYRETEYRRHKMWLQTMKGIQPHSAGSSWRNLHSEECSFSEHPPGDRGRGKSGHQDGQARIHPVPGRGQGSDHFRQPSDADLPGVQSGLRCPKAASPTTNTTKPKEICARLASPSPHLVLVLETYLKMCSS